MSSVEVAITGSSEKAWATCKAYILWSDTITSSKAC